MSDKREDEIEANREVVRSFYRGLNARSVEDVFVLYAEGAEVEVVDTGAFGGVNSASRESLGMLFDTFKRLDFEIVSMVADAERVAVEVASDGEWADGRAYGNRYHNLFVIDAGKIVCFREYPSGVRPTPR